MALVIHARAKTPPRPPLATATSTTTATVATMTTAATDQNSQACRSKNMLFIPLAVKFVIIQHIAATICHNMPHLQ